MCRRIVFRRRIPPRNELNIPNYRTKRIRRLRTNFRKRERGPKQLRTEIALRRPSNEDRLLFEIPESRSVPRFPYAFYYLGRGKSESVASYILHPVPSLVRPSIATVDCPPRAFMSVDGRETFDDIFETRFSHFLNEKTRVLQNGRRRLRF